MSIYQELLRQRHLTQRALDGWDCPALMRLGWAMLTGSSLARSAPFSSFIYTQAESCSRSFVHARLVVEPVETHPQVSPNGDRPQTVGLLLIIV